MCGTSEINIGANIIAGKKLATFIDLIFNKLNPIIKIITPPMALISLIPSLLNRCDIDELKRVIVPWKTKIKIDEAITPSP